MTHTPNNEIRALTSLRAFAAGLVLIHHFRFGEYQYPLAIEDPLGAIGMEGHIGVTMFFVLSGFLITARYFKPLTTRRLAWFDYVIKRAARIWPLYIAVLILTLAVQNLDFFPAIHLTLTQGYFLDYRWSGIITAWSLSVEETYYLIAPLIFLTLALGGLGTGSKKIPAVLGWGLVLATWVVGLFVIGLLLAEAAGKSPAEENGGFMAYDLPNMAYMTLFGRFFDFAVGIAGGLLFQAGQIARWFESRFGWVVADALSAVSLTGIGLCCIAMNRSGGVYSEGWIYNYPVAALTGVWIVALTCPTSWLARLMGLAPLVYLGRISYATYLLNYFIYEEVVSQLFAPSDALYLPALFAIMIAASVIAYELIERPAQRVVLGLTERVKRRLREGSSNR